MKVIYKIKVNNWEKYNGSLKKGHKAILISTGFLDDAKIQTLPQGGRLLYLGILLACGDLCSSSIEATHEQLVRYAGGSGQHVARLVELLQSLQLVTFEKTEVFIKRKEEKRKEEKRNATHKEPLTQLGLGEVDPLLDFKPPLVELWNTHGGTLPKCKSWTGGRAKKIALRWREQTPEEWTETIKRMAASAFCTGKNTSGWRADFDFLLKPDTWQKVNDGKYDTHRGTTHITNKTKIYDNLDALERQLNEREAAAT